MDARTEFSAPAGQPPYRPENYENKYYGRTTLRDALGNSLNVPAVKVLKYVGVPAVQDLARRLGITTLDNWDPRWLSLTLGGGEVRLLELTGAYATVARGGRHLPVESLLDVTTSRGLELHRAGDGQGGQQVVDPKSAYQLLHVLGDPGARLATFGPNTPLNLDRPHMVKTGTTDDYRDTWTIGCVPQVCVGVWMGNTNNDPMVKVSSSLTAGQGLGRDDAGADRAEPVAAGAVADAGGRHGDAHPERRGHAGGAAGPRGGVRGRSGARRHPRDGLDEAGLMGRQAPPPTAARREHRLRCRPQDDICGAAPRRPSPLRWRGGDGRGQAPVLRLPSPAHGRGAGG